MDIVSLHRIFIKESQRKKKEFYIRLLHIKNEDSLKILRLLMSIVQCILMFISLYSIQNIADEFHFLFLFNIFIFLFVFFEFRDYRTTYTNTLELFVMHYLVLSKRTSRQAFAFFSVSYMLTIVYNKKEILISMLLLTIIKGELAILFLLLLSVSLALFQNIIQLLAKIVTRVKRSFLLDSVISFIKLCIGMIVVNGIFIFLKGILVVLEEVLTQKFKNRKALDAYFEKEITSYISIQFEKVIKLFHTDFPYSKMLLLVFFICLCIGCGIKIFQESDKFYDRVRIRKFSINTNSTMNVSSLIVSIFKKRYTMYDVLQLKIFQAEYNQPIKNYVVPNVDVYLYGFLFLLFCKETQNTSIHFILFLYFGSIIIAVTIYTIFTKNEAFFRCTTDVHFLMQYRLSSYTIQKLIDSKKKILFFYSLIHVIVPIFLISIGYSIIVGITFQTIVLFLVILSMYVLMMNVYVHFTMIMIVYLLAQNQQNVQEYSTKVHVKVYSLYRMPYMMLHNVGLFMNIYFSFITDAVFPKIVCVIINFLYLIVLRKETIRFEKKGNALFRKMNL